LAPLFHRSSPNVPPDFILIDVDINVNRKPQIGAKRLRSPPIYLCFTRKIGSPITSVDVISALPSEQINVLPRFTLLKDNLNSKYYEMDDITPMDTVC
jgi:hypothetical protein